MNIHITDEILFNQLLSASFVKIEMGSKMYGLEHENSDTDLLCIYNTSEKELNSFFVSHHQLQYKKDNIDYIFVNLHAFIRNTLSGDSTINFEVINHEPLLDSPLDFLYKMRYDFYNYKILRSYLGLARRDIKHMNKNSKDDFIKNKKLTHAYRGYLTAKNIFSSSDITLTDYIITYIKNELWTISDRLERDSYAKELLTKINALRDEVNTEYDNDNITKFMSSEAQKKLNTHIKNITSRCPKMPDFDMGMFYDANENDVRY